MKEFIKDEESHGWRDFFIGLAIMLAIILIAYALQGNTPANVTGGSCSANDAGLGC